MRSLTKRLSSVDEGELDQGAQPNRAMRRRLAKQMGKRGRRTFVAEISKVRGKL